MKSPLRVLHLEDDPRDAELIQETLDADGIRCDVTRVETEADFIRSLEHGGVDLILADYTLPSFDGLSALKIAQGSNRGRALGEYFCSALRYPIARRPHSWE